MSYTALYRKFRPQEFEDVRGQEHTPLLEAASISITFMELPAAIALQEGQFPQGLPSAGCSQFTAFAKILAMVVFPVPLVPQNKYACPFALPEI